MNDIYYPLTKPRRICIIEAVHTEEDETIVTKARISPSMGFGRARTNVELRFPNGSTRRAVAFGLNDDVIVIRDASGDIGPGTELWELWEY